MLQKLGYDFLRYNRDNFVSLRRAHILGCESIDVVFDIGAHEGSYAQELRSLGYKKKIISFEPLSDAFHILEARCRKDSLWECRNIAIGDINGEAVINVSSHKTSSSLMNMAERHVEAMPSSSYIANEKVRISRLDSLLDGLVLSDERLYLKVDVQGYERHVLDGATGTLKQTRAIEIELSLAQLYEGSPMYYEMIDYLRHHGFCLVSVASGFSDPQSGHLLQADGIFIRQSQE